LPFKCGREQQRKLKNIVNNELIVEVKPLEEDEFARG